MQTVGHQSNKPVLEKSYQIILSTVIQVENEFYSRYAESLDLTKAEHFMQLAGIFKINEQGTAEYTRYDLAQVFLKQLLKRNLSLLPEPKDNSEFIEAIFGLLDYNIPFRENDRRIKVLEGLVSTYEKHLLNSAIVSLQSYASKVKTAKSQALSQNYEIYNKAFGDSFCNILIPIEAPFFRLGSQCLTTVDEVIEHLKKFIDYVKSDDDFYC